VRKRVFGLNWTDLLVITACGMTFTAAIVSQVHHAPPPGPPTELAIQQMAEELGVTPEQLRRAAEVVPPPARGMRPSPEQRDTARRALASILNVSLDRLDTVMGPHRPPGD
jgi:hypothetical protein